ncbi:hypothetical protein ACH4KN_32095 [Streptomyces sp. NPDC017546]|uniref:hypothetical protein n=1 Tax=Streptomyces sp. NPDC017546 TaxID=3365001 RepID=UPI00379215D0
MRIGLFTDSARPYASGESGSRCGQEGLGVAGLCREASRGAAALLGLLAKRFFGVPLLVTEHGVGVAARARALELLPVEQNLAAFRGICLELISHTPVGPRPRREADTARSRPDRRGTPMRDHAARHEPALHEPVLHAPARHEPSLHDHGDPPMTRPDDPAKSLHPHRDLCERAVDPREAAAGPEAHGLTGRSAARYRPRDVCAPAEELYARMSPRTRGPVAGGPPGPAPDADARATWTLLALLPGAACLATAGVLRVTEGALGDGTRTLVTVVGAVLACLALRACLGRGPLRAPTGGRAGLYSCWLLGYAVYGEELLAQVMTGGPDGPWGGTPAPLLGFAVAVAPAAWCAHLFAVHARRGPAGSRAPEESGAGVRLLFLAAVILFLGALLPLLYLADLGLGGGGVSVAAASLGVLFFVARLLAAHGLPGPGAVALAAACAVEAGAMALVLSARLPGLEPLAQPVDALVSAGGTGAVPALACGGAAVGLLLHAAFALSRAAAPTRT